MRTCVAVALMAVLVVSAFAGPPPVTGAQGVRLKDLAGKLTHVTIVFLGGAKEANVRILEVDGSSMTVLSPDGTTNPYEFSSIEEIQVQEGRLPGVDFVRRDPGILSKSQQAIVERALVRAYELYEGANQAQPLKMKAAMLLAANGNKEAWEYLEQLSKSNDLPTALQAIAYLYVAGETDYDKDKIAQGVSSPNRMNQTFALMLAGLVGDRSAEPDLVKAARDRSADLSVPAVRALARLEVTSATPLLLDMMSEKDDVKGEAAVFALTEVGGSNVINQLHTMLTQSEGIVRGRVIRVLAALGDPIGEKLLREEVMDTPSLANQAAMVLARQGDLDAMTHLRNVLAQRYDPQLSLHIFHAEAAVALIQGGDPASKGTLQQLLRLDDKDVQRVVYSLIADLGDRTLITLTQAGIESPSKLISYSATEAALACADSAFRERLAAYRADDSMRAAAPRI